MVAAVADPAEGKSGARAGERAIPVDDAGADAREESLPRGAIIRQPPTEYPWGMREMNVEDLDGHRLRLGTDGGTENRTYNYEKENDAI